MSRAPLLLLALSALYRGCASELTLMQPPSATVRSGEGVRLPCTMSIDGIARITWTQVKPGGGPKFVYQFRGSGDEGRGPDMPSRFSVSHEPSGNLWNLVISGAQTEDEAEYYCSLWYASGRRWIFGGGTQLNVVSGETKAPTLSIFPPSTEEIDTNKATLVCQCQDFYPAALAWTWTVNDQTINTGVDSTRPTKQTDNNLFMAGSFLSINAIDWKANNMYTCKATHEGKTFQASVKQSECI